MTHSLGLLFELKDELLEAVPAASRWERGAFLRHIKGTFARGEKFLADSHGEGAGGIELAEARAVFIDALLCQIWGHGVHDSEGAEAKDSDKCAMVAIGGYGRGELSPGSDIDLMFVFAKR
ncbi:MAG: hypothetical protein HOL05_01485, partial [Nitrospinaceae bacterium]|nr:hypothetical protein [Nitrospinaceae bacterium]